MFLTVNKVFPPYLEDVTKGLDRSDWKNNQIQKAGLENLGLRPVGQGKMANKYTYMGFTLLEVMVAMAIIAIALTAVLGSQSGQGSGDAGVAEEDARQTDGEAPRGGPEVA